MSFEYVRVYAKVCKCLKNNVLFFRVIYNDIDNQTKIVFTLHYMCLQIHY